jgi:hypothetical protein
MLDLIYSGHGDAALSYFDGAWPEGLAGKERFLKSFMEQLKKSPYSSAVARMNGW